MYLIILLVKFMYDSVTGTSSLNLGVTKNNLFCHRSKASGITLVGSGLVSFLSVVAFMDEK